jgi:hypothetical protein
MQQWFLFFDKQHFLLIHKKKHYFNKCLGKVLNFASVKAGGTHNYDLI